MSTNLPVVYVVSRGSHLRWAELGLSVSTPGLLSQGGQTDPHPRRSEGS